MYNYQGKIKKHKETDKGTQLLIELPSQFVSYQIEKYTGKNLIGCEIYIDDERKLTDKQRLMILATIKDIADFTGYAPSDREFLREYLTADFCDLNDLEYFSLSRRNERSASVTVAREFINYLIDFCLSNDIPLSEHILKRTEDIDKAIMYCLRERICIITGKKGADIHHVTGSRVGMGRNRKTINHLDLEIIPLSREWHEKVHTEGEVEIFEKYHIYGIKATLELLNKLKINYSEID